MKVNLSGLLEMISFIIFISSTAKSKDVPSGSVLAGIKIAKKGRFNPPSTALG